MSRHAARIGADRDLGQFRGRLARNVEDRDRVSLWVDVDEFGVVARQAIGLDWRGPTDVWARAGSALLATKKQLTTANDRSAAAPSRRVNLFMPLVSPR